MKSEHAGRALSPFLELPLPLLFAAARLARDQWANLPFGARIALIRKQYRLDEWPNMQEATWFFRDSGIGVFAAYQTHERKLFHHASRSRSRTDFLTHPPFGYRSLAPTVPIECLPTALARIIDEDPTSLLRLNPPQGVLSVDEDAQAISFRNDLLGLGKTFLLRDNGGVALASRPLAAHLLAGIAPEPSVEGWAAEQLQGWFLGDLSPYKNVRRLLGGTLLLLNHDGLSEQRHNLAPRWFTEQPSKNAYYGFDRFLAEFREFANPTNIEIALSGGRDSRASAALASSLYLDRVRFRTNEPPKLEGIVARQLIERLPNFKAFVCDGTVAINAADHTIWKANVPRMNEAEVHSRAKEWARLGEGIVASASIYSNPPKGSPFSQHNEFFPTFSGVAGECSKAYYWSPRMVSGAYARNLQHFKQDISSPVGERIKCHPLTTQSSFPFICAEMRTFLQALVREGQREAADFGIHGYRFFDYWWLTNRFGSGTTVAYTGTTTMMPFLVPEYISEALQGPVLDRARAEFLSRIVTHYRPEWKDVPYFDQLQNSVPQDQVRYYRDRSLLWEGKLATDFLSMLRDSPAFSDPYDRQATVSYFENVTASSDQKASLNLKALSLVHRHAFWELCNSIRSLLANARAA